MPYRELIPEPLAVRIPIAMALIGVRRTKLYELIKAGDLRTVKLGRATSVTMTSLKRLLERQDEKVAPS